MPVTFTTFNPERALEQIGHDLQLLAEIAELFFEDAPRMLADIEAAIELDDAEALRQAAHALKGAVANFAAETPREIAADLELQGFESRMEGAADRLLGLRASLATFEAELQALLASR